MRVLVAGLSRTGTTSMTIALKELQFDCLHHEHYMFPKNVLFPGWGSNHFLLPLFESLSSHSPIETTKLKEQLQDVDAISDWPACLFSTEIAEAFPECKVILTVRDVDSWINSVLTLRNEVKKRDDYLAASPTKIPSEVIEMTNRRAQMATNLVGNRDYWPEDREELRQMFLRHNNNIISKIDSSRLLIWNIGDGWDKLCEFLEVPVPSTPFPQGHSIQAGFAEKFMENFHQ
eukprot:m.125899 g.125899  ORF g.125899 m.125899 type:complete len:232 (-) comp14504_c0_seq2:709-1404(-)